MKTLFEKHSTVYKDEITDAESRLMSFEQFQEAIKEYENNKWIDAKKNPPLDDEYKNTYSKNNFGWFTSYAYYEKDEWLDQENNIVDDVIKYQNILPPEDK